MHEIKENIYLLEKEEILLFSKNIIKIAEPLFGKDYITEESLLKENNIIMVYKEDKILKGFSFSEIINKENYLEYTKGKDLGVGKFPCGIFKTVLVDEKFQKQGIGTKLLIASEDLFKEQGITEIISPAWEYDNIINSKKLLENNGFKKIIGIKHFWKKECDNNEFSCAARKNNKCICNCIFYRKEVNR